VIRSAFSNSHKLSYLDIETLAPAPFVPSASDITPTRRVNENLDTDSAKPPPPYSWTQSSDSLTIVFPLPSNTPKSHIYVNISPKYLTVLIQNENPEASLTTSAPRNARALGYDRS